VTAPRTLTSLGLAVAMLLARGPLARAEPAEPDDDNGAADDSADADAGAPDPVPVAPAKTGIPRTHVIRAGETLSTLSQQYLRDRMAWPQLWALNPEITDPNRVYPGQVVRLGGPAPKEAKVAAASPEPAVDEARARAAAARPPVAGRGMVRLAPPHPAAPHLRQLGFVDEGALKASGTIYGSMEEKIMLATGDQAYVQFPSGQMPKSATHYSVYQVDAGHPVREPGSTTVLGYLVHVCGEAVIEDATSDSQVATARLINLAEPVERGYRVGPMLPEIRQIAPKKNEASLTARVIAAMAPGSLISSETFVVLNRGRRHGVEAGNRFLVLRQGDGLKRTLEGWDTTDPRFPPRTIAEILAVDVQDETTVGWIARGDRELRIGDVADLQRGY